MLEDSHLGVTDCRRLTAGLTHIVDKWSVVLILQLEPGPRRFGELRRLLEGVSQKVLSSTLRGLERDGFVTRTVLPTKPPTVEYALSPLGVGILAPVKCLGVWTMSNIGYIEQARSTYDAAESR